MPEVPAEPNSKSAVKMTLYTLGFFFNAAKASVFLVKKKKPTWQMDHLNGVGGVVREGEDSFDCIIRKTKAQLGVTPITPRLFCKWIIGPDVIVRCYTESLDIYLGSFNASNEQVHIIRVENIPNLALRGSQLVEGVSWLVPMALAGSNFQLIETR